MGETRRSLETTAPPSLGQFMPIARDEGGIHVSNRIALLGKPLPKLRTGPQIAPDTVPCISALVEGGRERFQMGTQGPAP
jgi:hypothetical protein